MWFALALALVLAFLLLSCLRHWLKKKLLPGPRGLPVAGVGLTLVSRGFTGILQFATELADKYGGRIEASVAGINFVLLTDPDAVEVEGVDMERAIAMRLAAKVIPPLKKPFQTSFQIVLSSSAHIKKGVDYQILKPWLGDGLLLSDGLKWQSRRKLLTPAFHFKILEDAQRIISKNAQLLCSNLLATNGQPTDIDEIIRVSTLKVICESAMGVPFNVEDKHGKDYLEVLKLATEKALHRYLAFWLKNDFLYKLTSTGRAFFKDIEVLHSFTNKVINDRRKIYHTIKDENKEKRKAFLDCLLDLEITNPRAININEEVDTFMFEGHDTTSAALTFGLYLLANHPEVQERAAEEQYDLFGDEDKLPSIQDLNKMTYLEMIIKETLRLYPSVPYISRLLTQDLVLDDKVTIPPGYSVAIMPYLIHRNEKYWENPEEFNPERFAPGVTRHPFSYIPFSAGPRNCIGQKFAMMELKLMLSLVLRKCKLEPVTIELKIVPLVILKNEKPIYVKILQREKK